MQLTDTHCHLDFDRFDQDRQQVLQRAVRAGVERMLVPGIDLNSSAAAIQLAKTHEIVFAAVGVHPNHGAAWHADAYQMLNEMAGQKKVVAIGEIGMDYYWDDTPPNLQRKIIREQLNLAAQTGLPVVVHNREATQDLLPILLEWQQDLAADGNPLAEAPGVLHSFSEDFPTAEKFLAAGFYIGITGPVTFNKALELQEVACRIPLEKLLIETDSPYLTPHPYRGKRNEPGYVYYVAEKIAELRGLTPNEVGTISTNNAKILFNW